MRIISGTRKGKRIKAPTNLDVRPTTDFAKEALFNILNNLVDIYDAEVLDLFTGIGSISYEFASREAKFIVSIDNNPACIKFVDKIISELNFTQIQTIKTDAIKYLETNRRKYDLIYADPPYSFEHTEKIPQLVFQNEMLNEDGILIVEHPISLSFIEHPNVFDYRKYGSVCYSFFKNKKQEEEQE